MPHQGSRAAGAWPVGIGGKAFKQAALAGRPPGVERRTEQGQQPGALVLQEGALGLKPEPNGGLVYAGRTYRRPRRALAGTKGQTGWSLVPRQLERALRGKAWCQITARGCSSKRSLTFLWFF